VSQVAVVIVTYNGSPWIEGCVESCLKQSCSPWIWVVDNASTDGTADRVKSRFAAARVIRLNSNVGFGMGNNVGIAAALTAGADFVLLLNQDALLAEEALTSLLAFMHEHPEVEVSSPLHCSPDFSRVDCRTYTGYLSRFASDWLCDAAMGQSKDWYRIRGINAAVWMVRSATFRRVGGFDPLFFMYAEDDDLIARLAHHKAVFGLVPAIRALHLRQSPPAPTLRGAAKIRSMARREQSDLTLASKAIGDSFVWRLMTLLRQGFVDPVLDLAFDRNLSRAAARLLAAATVLTRLRRIHRHAKLTASPGPHFLEVES
jgi:GT2 family glycosyltransferase